MSERASLMGGTAGLELRDITELGMPRIDFTLNTENGGKPSRAAEIARKETDRYLKEGSRYKPIKSLSYFREPKAERDTAKTPYKTQKAPLRVGADQDPSQAICFNCNHAGHLKSDCTAPCRTCLGKVHTGRCQRA